PDEEVDVARHELPHVGQRPFERVEDERDDEQQDEPDHQGQADADDLQELLATHELRYRANRRRGFWSTRAARSKVASTFGRARSSCEPGVRVRKVSYAAMVDLKLSTRALEIRDSITLAISARARDMRSRGVDVVS